MPTVPPTISALHDAFRSGILRPSDVAAHWLARPHGERAAPVWISTFDEEQLLRRAAALDAQLAHDRHRALASPVFGALCGVKDNIDVAGLATTAACPAFAYRPERHAAVVAALEHAGAIVLGKTNLDQFATGLVGTRSPYGAVPNAFDVTVIAGGSSSGSASAVARGHVHFALGTDTAGSGRVPAGLNNIVGWKPTRGLLSTEGVVPACRSLDCVSVFALTVADAARVIAAAMTGTRPLNRARPRHRIAFAIPRHSQMEFFGDRAAADAFADAFARMASLGAIAREIDFAPFRDVAAMLYEGPHVAERHAAIAAFFAASPEAIDPTVRAIIGTGRKYSASDLFTAQARLATMRHALAAVFDEVDCLVVPTVPTIYTIEQVMSDPVELNRRLGTYTNFVNLLDLAAIAVPATMRADGIPAGITLIGPAGSDLALAEIAQRFHADTRLPLGALGVAMPPSESLAPRANVAQLAVVGAHLSGLPLNHELTSRGGRLVCRARTAAAYRLFALPGTTPPKPGLMRVPGAGHSIELEVWELSETAFGSFVAAVPRPLCIGTLELDDGTLVKGFLCEGAALADAADISRYGGWRNYLEARTPLSAAVA